MHDADAQEGGKWSDTRGTGVALFRANEIRHSTNVSLQFQAAAATALRIVGGNKKKKQERCFNRQLRPQHYALLEEIGLLLTSKQISETKRKAKTEIPFRNPFLGFFVCGSAGCRSLGLPDLNWALYR